MIEVRDAHKRYGKLTALDGVSLRVAAGERVALVGSNGSGKTTLLRAITGLVRVRGSIHIAGIDVQRKPAEALRGVAYVPQSAPPLEAPVGELVRAYCALRGLAVAEVAAMTAPFGLELDAITGTRVRDLSGGMKQKLMAGLAFASRAPLLVCDEPTASLDVAARNVFFSALAARSPDSTLLLCSHRLEEASALVTRVVEMKDGRVVRDAPTAVEDSDVRALRREYLGGRTEHAHGGKSALRGSP